MQENNNPISGTIPPTEMRKLYKEFQDTLTAYQVKGTDHPYYNTMLRNFMTLKLGRSYDTEQYLRFIESAALADSMILPRYIYYAKMVFNSQSAMDNFRTGVYNLDNTVQLEPAFTSLTDFTLGYDFNELPKNKLKIFRDFFNATTSGVTDKKVNHPFINYAVTDIGRLYIPSSSNVTLNPSVIFAGSPVYSFTLQPTQQSVKFGNGNTQNYKVYTITAPVGAPVFSHSLNTYLLKKYLFDHSIPGYFFAARQPTVDEQYLLPEKKAYLSYAYNYQDYPATRVLDSLQTDYLGNITAFQGNIMSYGNPTLPGHINNLYFANPATQTSGTDFPRLEYILNAVKAYLLQNGANRLFFSGDAVREVLPNNRLTAFRCSDDVFWYRYFDDNESLFNVFIQTPGYLDTSLIKNLELETLEVDLGSANSYSFTITVKEAGNPNLKLTLKGSTDFVIGKNKVLHDVLLAQGLLDEAPLYDSIHNCERQLLEAAIYQGKVNYLNYMDSLRNQLINDFTAYLSGNGIQEELWVQYRSQRFNYTLYYYDRAGNLIRTIPPAGVNMLTNATLPLVNGHRENDNVVSYLYPNHSKPSDYKYNSLNQAVSQITPDGGHSRFFYDGAGRLIFSQNEKQRLTGKMSYTLYDAQNRIWETGEAKIACRELSSGIAPDCDYEDPETGLPTIYPPIISRLKHMTHKDVVLYVRSLSRQEVVLTHYDTAAFNLGSVTGLAAQENLRQRVSSIKYFDVLNPGNIHFTGWNYAMHFSYDISGNVKTLVRDFPAWNFNQQRFKRIDYDYDLISGKVNLLSYNRGLPDQFYQKYKYDDDNRIVSTESSSDGVIWKLDAGYEYYQHGPLARMSLGEQRVQGVDYAYTIQGWLKAVNGDVLNRGKDMGDDGIGNSVYASDAMAFSLKYFNGDYEPIGDKEVLLVSDNGKNMYNGNIPVSSMSLRPFDDLNTQYTYDQLNRLMKAEYAEIAGDHSLQPTRQYYNSYGYDADGNLEKLVRNGGNANQLLMDSLVYRYAPGGNNNKLLNVNDYADNHYDNDLRKFTDGSVSRYEYDKTGNLTKDLVTGQDSILWNHYNKVTKTRRDSLDNSLAFSYDGAGHRYLKSVMSESGDHFYNDREYNVRDAQGNILAVYKEESEFQERRFEVMVRLTEEITALVPVNDYIGQFLAETYALDGQFKQSVVDYALRHQPDWSGHRLKEKEASWFIGNNLAMKSRYLDSAFNNNDFYTALKDFLLGGHEFFVADGLKGLFSNRETGAYHWQQFLDMLLALNGNENSVNSVLLKLCEQGDIMEGVMRTFRARYSPDCAANSTWVRNVIMQDPLLFQEISKQFLYLFKKDEPSFRAFLRELTHDSGIMNPDFMAGLEGLAAVFKESLHSYVPGPEFGNFVDFWEIGQNIVYADMDSAAKLESVYNFNIPVFLNELYGLTGSLGPLVSGLAAIADLHPFGYLAQAQHHLTITVPAIRLAGILKYRRMYLSSHVLYGSSRLGTKDYLPGQYYTMHDYQAGIPLIDTLSLTTRMPWYSGGYNDLIKSNSQHYGNGQTDNGQLGAQHHIGQKQYELTNHLGNVQATVSDLKYRDVKETDWQPALKSAYDYYPFGMLMPERYVSDTTAACMTVTKSSWVWKWIVIGCWDVYTWVWPNYVPVGHAQAYRENNDLIFEAGTPVDYVRFDLPVTAFEEYELQFAFDHYETVGKGAALEIQEFKEGKWGRVSAHQLSSMPSRLDIGLHPVTATVRVIIRGPIRVRVGRMCLAKRERIQEDVLVDICDRVEDRYRFGFNGMEKDNEMKGLGNSLDFGARMLDTRIGRWFAMDPLAAKYPFASPYNFALNTPIQAKDPDGKVVIFINGNHYGDGGKASYWRTSEKYTAGYRSERNWFGKMVTSPVTMKKEYAFDKNIMNILGDHKAIYRDGAFGGWAPFNSDKNADPEERRRGGYAQGIVDAKLIINNLERDKNGNITETIKIISHSMGGAYAKGYGNAILDYAERNKISGVKIELEADFAPFQPDKQKAISRKNMGPTYQFSHKGDKIAGDKPMEGAVQVNTEEDSEGNGFQQHTVPSFKNSSEQLKTK